MNNKLNIFAIVGSASSNSSNLKLLEFVSEKASENCNIKIFDGLKSLPHFDPDLSIENTPQPIISFREEINQADGILICTPEYVFSIPSGLKNAIEWCVSTVVFSDKPTGIITASASGAKGHEELQLILKTLMAKFTSDTTLLIQGIKGKIKDNVDLVDEKTKIELDAFIVAFIDLVKNSF